MVERSAQDILLGAALGVFLTLGIILSIGISLIQPCVVITMPSGSTARVSGNGTDELISRLDIEVRAVDSVTFDAIYGG